MSAAYGLPMAPGALALAVLLASSAAAQLPPPAPAVKVDPHAKQGAEYGRAVAELPAWNGVWQTASGMVFDPATQENAHDKNRGTDFGSPGGSRMRPPYNAVWEADYVKRIQEHAAGRARDPVSDCVVEGFPRLLQVPGAIEIVVLPKVVFMNWSYFDQTRRIYTDGRKHPPREVAYARELGHSIGHWEGDVLVIDTVDMRPFIYDQTEAPFSDQIHVTERIWMLENGMLRDEITIEDPVAFTRPWKVVRDFARSVVDHKDPSRPGPDWTDVESTFCTLNRNASDANGVNGAQLPSDGR